MRISSIRRFLPRQAVSQFFLPSLTNNLTHQQSIFHCNTYIKSSTHHNCQMIHLSQCQDIEAEKIQQRQRQRQRILTDKWMIQICFLKGRKIKSAPQPCHWGRKNLFEGTARSYRSLERRRTQRPEYLPLDQFKPAGLITLFYLWISILLVLRTGNARN
jgi:hypothetical protein